MPVVVGRAMRNETPVFIGEMRHVEFSPYWNVPPSILHNELLPRIAEESFLSPARRHGNRANRA